MVTDPSTRVLPTESLRTLRDRNAGLLNAPRAEIQAALVRQVAILEAVACRFQSKATLEKRPENASAYSKMALSAISPLVKRIRRH